MKPTLAQATVLFVTGRTGRTIGRVERRWLPVIEELCRRGTSVHVICALRAPFEAPAREAGATIAPYRLDKFNLIRTRSRMRKYLLRFRPAIVHSTGYEADVLTRWAAHGLPTRLVTSAIGAAWPPAGIGPLDTWVRRRLDRDTLVRVDRFFVDGEDLASRLASVGVDRARIIVDPPSVALGEVVERAREPLDLGPGPVVGYAGALEPSRGLVTLAAAAPRIASGAPGVRIVVAGEGPARRSLLSAAADGRIELLGPVPSVPAALAAFDVCVFPSNRPGTPTSLLEAAALGRPIVAAAVLGIADVFSPEEVRLVPPDDSEALAAAILELLTHPDRARAFGERARLAVIDRMTVRGTVERHLACYEELLGEL